MYKLIVTIIRYSKASKTSFILNVGSSMPAHKYLVIGMQQTPFRKLSVDPVVRIYNYPRRAQMIL